MRADMIFDFFSQLLDIDTGIPACPARHIRSRREHRLSMSNVRSQCAKCYNTQHFWDKGGEMNSLAPSFAEVWISHILGAMPENVKHRLVAVRTVLVERFAGIVF